MVHDAWWWGSHPGFATYVPPPAATHPTRPLPPPSFNHAAAHRVTERAAANPCVRTRRGRAARAGRCRSERSGTPFRGPSFGTFDCSRQLRAQEGPRVSRGGPTWAKEWARSGPTSGPEAGPARRQSGPTTAPNWALVSTVTPVTTTTSPSYFTRRAIHRIIAYMW